MKIKQYELKITDKIEVKFLNYGGIIQNILVPDRSGKLGDVVLGFDDPESYQGNHPYFGALIGRYANRIANGTFLLEGETYHVPVNNGPNSLHGGLQGFDRMFWEVERISESTYRLQYLSKDGEQGYPGNLKVTVLYSVTQDRELVIEYSAMTDKTTILNLTNHSYFNLGSDPTVLEHDLWIDSESFTEVDEFLTPTGNILKLPRSMDFSSMEKIASRIEEVPGGFDHNYVLSKTPFEKPKARLKDIKTGRMMEVFTDQPGLQFYSGNFLDGTLQGKEGIHYQKHAGLCLETQHYPDSPHHPNFPSTVLAPRQTFTSKTIYRFSLN